jgi:UDP-N-acetylglucosamine 2-epimerase (non-hydrolysing)
MEEASVMMVGLNSEKIIQALEILKNQTRGEARLLNLVSDYSKNNVSEKVIRIILSYIDYINRVVWNIVKD